MRLLMLSPAFGPETMAGALADRLSAGYPRDGRWHRPAVEVTRAGPDAPPEAIAAADAVLIVADADPVTGRARDLAALAPLFRRCGDALAAGGRRPPVYVGPALGVDLAAAQAVVDGAKRLGVPLLALAPLPLAPRLPALDLGTGGRVTEALLLAPDGLAELDPGAVEALLALVERRPGGERGIRRVTRLEGAAVWRAGAAGRWSRRLLAAALARSDDLLGHSREDGRPQDMLAGGELARRTTAPAALLIEHAGGLRSALLLCPGAVGGYTFAAQAGAEVRSTQLLVSRLPGTTALAPLAAAVESFVRGEAPPSAGRALLAIEIIERARRTSA